MRRIDVIVRNFWDVQQAAHAADVDKRTVGLDTAYCTDDHFPDFEAVHLALN